MKAPILAVRDIKADAVIALITGAPTVDTGLRSFGDVVRSDRSEMHLHPEDYEVYHVGDYDRTSGVLLPRPTPERVALATDFVRES